MRTRLLSNPFVSLVLLVLLGTVAAADPNTDAARWVEVLVRNTKIDPPAKPIAVVFDSGSLFDAASPCTKLLVVSKATAADLTTLASCMTTATKQLGLDGQPLPDAKTVISVGTRYLRSWFKPSLAQSIAIPANHKAIGASINRPTDSKGAGVGIMIYVVSDAAGQPTAIYAYAGRWAYPI